MKKGFSINKSADTKVLYRTFISNMNIKLENEQSIVLRSEVTEYQSQTSVGQTFKMIRNFKRKRKKRRKK